MKMNKFGKLGVGVLQTAILAIILLTVLFTLYSDLIPEAQTAGDELNASGVPLGSFFTGGGIVFLIIMAALLILVIKSFMGGRK